MTTATLAQLRGTLRFAQKAHAAHVLFGQTANAERARAHIERLEAQITEMEIEAEVEALLAKELA